MSDESHTEVRQADGRSQAGIALLLVIVCLAIIAPFTASFNLKARVDWKASINTRDEVAAKHAQRGAMQLSLLLFEIQRQVFNQKQFRDFMGSMDITQVAPYLMSVFGTAEGAEELGGLVGIDTSALGELGLDGGSFEYRLYPESGKLNINCLAVQREGADNPAGRTVETLEALMAPGIYNPLFEEVKPDGNTYQRTDITRAIADYIDADRQRFDLLRLRSTSGDEQREYRYTELADPYEARNGRLDSVDELHLVEGIDDDWMEAFGRELTVYGQCKVNLNFASAELIAQVIRYAVTEEDQWKTEGENFLLVTMPLANYVVEYRSLNLFDDFEQFRTLISDPSQGFGGGLFGSSDDDYSSTLRIPEGIEVYAAAGNAGDPDPNGEEGETLANDHRGLADIATVAPERVYTVEVITTVGNVSKRLTAVYDMQYARAQSQGKGAWLYIRED